MLIFQGPDYSKLGISPEEMQGQMQKWFDWVDKLQKENQYGGGHALHPTGKVLSGNNVVTDGPFAESKELVGGYFIVKAKDIDEAIAISKDFPDFEYGGKVQVREVVVFDK